MSKEPPYGYVDCCYPGCKGKMGLHFDPADFSFSRICRPCRIKRQTHVYVAFCKHGTPVHHLSTDYDFPEAPSPSCGCNDFTNAKWDWIHKGTARLGFEIIEKSG